MVDCGQAVQAGADDLAGAPFPLPAATGFAGLFKRPASLWARVALVAVNLAAVTAFLLSYSRHGVGFGPYRIDLAAYRAGGRTWLRGEDLYGQVPVIQGLPLPFTYPPIAAVRAGAAGAAADGRRRHAAHRGQHRAGRRGAAGVPAPPGRAGRGASVGRVLAAAGGAAARTGAQHPGLRPDQHRADGPGGAGLPDRGSRAGRAAR